MSRKPWHDKQDADPVFRIFHTAFLSRVKAQLILRQLDEQGFAVVKKSDLPQKGFADAVLAAASKRD